jgi:hypothetical protein
MLSVLDLVLALGVASAQPQPLTEEQRKALLDYQLTVPRANQLITTMEAMTKYMMARPDFQQVLAKSMKSTPAERRAQLEADPKAMAILQENHLSASDYMVGVPALRMALLAASGLPAGPSLVVSPANLEFAKKNLAELKPKMDAVDGLRSKTQ